MKNVLQQLTFLLFIVLIFAQGVSAQLPDCDKYYRHITDNNQIQTVDPATNTTSINSIGMPAGANGLAVAKNFFSSTPSPTFYTTKNDRYYYYNGSTWVNTGHSTGGYAAVNPGGAGPYIYNLSGSAAKLYRYDGTGPGTLFLDLGSFAGPYDVMGDSDGNVYVLFTGGTQSLNMYDVNANLVCTYNLVNMPNASNGGGYSIVNGVMYVGSGAGLYKGIINGNTITFTSDGAGSFGDYANCAFPPINLTISSPDDLTCQNTTVQLSSTTSITGPQYSWSGPGIVSGGNTSNPIVNKPGTYTLTVTSSGGGCGGTSTQQVTVSKTGGLTLTISASEETICKDESSTISVSASGGASPYSYNWDNGLPSGSTSNTVSPNTTTTYKCIITDKSGCDGTVSKTINVNQLPTIDAGVDQTICDLSKATLSGSGAGTGGSYIWNNGVIDGTPFTPGSGTTTYKVTGEDVNGCKNTDFVDISIGSLPSIDAGSNQTVCDDGTQVTLTGSGAGTGGTYNWDNGITDGVAFTPDLGTTTYKVIGTNAEGCENTDQVDVIVNPLPPIAAGVNQSVCDDGTQITLTGSGAGTGGSYIWDNGESDGVAFTPSPGTTTYEVTGTDVKGCENTDQMDVVVNSLPTINAGADQTICDGSQTTLNGSGAGTGGSYIWDNSISDGVAFVPSSGTTTYTVTGKDANGCENTDQVTINAGSLPSIDAGSDQIVCDDGTQVTLTGSGAGTGGTYNWDNGITDGVAFTPSPGTTTYEVTGKNVEGCENTDQVSVTVNPLPTIDAGSNQTVCDDSSQVTLNGSGAGTGGSYIWDNGGTDGVAFIPSTGTYTVTGTDVNGCENTDQMDVVVNPLPPIDAGTNQIVCDGSQVTLSGSGAGTGGTYTWDNSGSNGVAFTPSIGTTSYTVTGTDVNGCENTDQMDVIVNSLPPINAGTSQTICDGSQMVLNGSGAGVGGTYSWDNGISDGIAFTPSIGTITYIVTGIDANGCENTDQVDITVTTAPVASFTVDQNKGCSPLLVNFTNTSGNNGDTCKYMLNNSEVLNGCNPSYTFTQPGCYDVTLTIKNSYGCTSSVTEPDLICIEDQPVASFSANPGSIGEITSEVEFTNSSTGANMYDWMFGDGGNSNEVNPIHEYDYQENKKVEDEEYVVYLIASNDLGCVDTTSIVIPIEEELIYYIPNTFTPDQDDYNQVFKPVFTSGFSPQDYHLTIFNRWGELLFESHDADIGWDGTYGIENSGIVKEGIYIWKIEFRMKNNDERKNAIGHITLLK